MGQKYIDSAWCDVVSMDVCHILLGRPWYDGRKNTYTLSIKRKRIVLKPIRENMETKIEGEKNLLSLSQFMEE